MRPFPGCCAALTELILDDAAAHHVVQVGHFVHCPHQYGSPVQLISTILIIQWPGLLNIL